MTIKGINLVTGSVKTISSDSVDSRGHHKC